jgi:hypothetical protein
MPLNGTTPRHPAQSTRTKFSPVPARPGQCPDRLRACEHVFVTAQGSACAQFKRALKRQNFMLAWTMAAELPKVQLADALALLLLARDLEPARFDRAAPRWHARLCTERQLSASEAQLDRTPLSHSVGLTQGR